MVRNRLHFPLSVTHLNCNMSLRAYYCEKSHRNDPNTIRLVSFRFDWMRCERAEWNLLNRRTDIYAQTTASYVYMCVCACIYIVR